MFLNGLEMSNNSMLDIYLLGNITCVVPAQQSVTNIEQCPGNGGIFIHN